MSNRRKREIVALLHANCTLHGMHTRTHNARSTERALWKCDECGRAKGVHVHVRVRRVIEELVRTCVRCGEKVVAMRYRRTEGGERR